MYYTAAFLWKYLSNIFYTLEVYDVERPNELGKNITDDVVRGT